MTKRLFTLEVDIDPHENPTGLIESALYDIYEVNSVKLSEEFANV